MKKNTNALGHLLSTAGFILFMAIYIPCNLLYQAMTALKQDYEDHLDTYQ
jgi:hypothetical protein